LALGGAFRQVSTVHLACGEEAFSAWGPRAVSAGGTIANLLLAVLAAFLLPRATGGRLRAFLWTSFVVNGLTGGGYLMTSPIFRFGDWEAFLSGLARSLPWWIGLSLAGVAISIAVLRAGARWLAPFLGASAERSPR